MGNDRIRLKNLPKQVQWTLLFKIAFFEVSKLQNAKNGVGMTIIKFLYYFINCNFQLWPRPHDSGSSMTRIRNGHHYSGIWVM